MAKSKTLEERVKFLEERQDILCKYVKLLDDRWDEVVKFLKAIGNIWKR